MCQEGMREKKHPMVLRLVHSLLMKLFPLAVTFTSISYNPRLPFGETGSLEWTGIGFFPFPRVIGLW